MALVDGDNHRFDRIKEQTQTRDGEVAIVIDVIHVIHVLEYVFGAAWCFFAEGDPAA